MTAGSGLFSAIATRFPNSRWSQRESAQIVEMVEKNNRLGKRTHAPSSGHRKRIRWIIINSTSGGLSRTHSPDRPDVDACSSPHEPRNRTSWIVLGMIQCTVIIAVPLAAALAEASQIQNAHNDSSLSGVPSSPCNSLLPAGATALFVQGASPIHVNSLQAGGGVPAGLNVNLWSTNGRKPLSPVEWDMSTYTGYSAPPGSMVESISNRSGGTGAQVAGNGSTDWRSDRC